MSVEEIIKAYSDELDNWDFFSDHPVCRMEKGHIQVCLRNYNWYITKEIILNPMDAIKALFEISWIAEYEDGEDIDWVSGSKYWVKD